MTGRPPAGHRGVALLILGAVASLFAIGGVAVVRRGSQPDGMGVVGRKPAVSGVLLRGARWSLGQDGIPTVVVYATTGCPHCNAELARWRGLRHEITADGPGKVHLVVILNAPPGEGAATRLDGFDVVIDAGGAIRDSLGVRVVPHTVYVDAAGTVVAESVGETRTRRMRELLAMAQREE